MDSDEEKLDSATADKLKQDVPKAETASRIVVRADDTTVASAALKHWRSRFVRHQKTMQSAEIDRLHQQNEMRPKFFKLAAWLSWTIIIGNFVLVGWYAWHAKAGIEPYVIVAWISSTVVEILGIMYIIAQYLFPGAKKKKAKLLSSSSK